ncbi:ATP-binding cassette domain-containing protein [Corynebacterium breve]|uniref:ATP-binding cassette domain-containing protein n=1 Tax=Corynebacterium breve TaxID=3049799 RepID=A0ABY8VK90_9CORY|nr:ATP-binding cassette domain-containing protein [Corynebacterium breve]WIM68614.1 ATP-binding cassette domain-containing protein [Corynebacterium breve]
MASTLRRLTPAPPKLTVALGFLAVAWILGPVFALANRAPWAKLPSIVSDPQTHDLLTVTVCSAVLSTLITLTLGLPLAIWIQHLHRGSDLIRILVFLPLAMPPVVGGLALTALIGRHGLLSPLLDATNIQFAFAFAGVVAAHTFVSLPFVVVTIDSALRNIDPEIPSSASGIGFPPGKIVRRIVLPAIAPSIATAAGLAFSRSLGEFGTTLTFAGSMPGVTRTMSLGIYLARETDQDTAYGLAVLLIFLALGTLLLSTLPTLLVKQHQPVARSTDKINTDLLKKLTTPETTGVSIDVDGVHIPADRLTAVVGENGSGKTTLLNLIAGRVRGAEVKLGDRIVDKPGMRPVPAHKRGVVILTQQPGLPHTTTVLGAIEMVTDDEERAKQLLGAAGLASFEDVPIPALSGGQAAQVALVRALAARPSVLLLDEPLAAVDIKSARAWRRVLRAIGPQRTTVLVTHNPLDITGISEHLVVMEKGANVSSGPTATELQQPTNSFMARISGLNRLKGVITGSKNGTIRVDVDGVSVSGVVPDAELDIEEVTIGSPAVVTFLPTATTIRLEDNTTIDKTKQQSARNIWPGTILSVEASPTEVHLIIDIVGQSITVPVTRDAALDLELEPGTKVECVTKALSIWVHPQRVEDSSD